jgi:hypothetical protein
MYKCVVQSWGVGAIVRDCRGIGRMGIMCKVGIVDYSVSGECGGGRSSEGRGRSGTNAEEWMRA